MSEVPKFYPEAIAESVEMPPGGLRVLRELMDAARSNDPLGCLIRAHRELEGYISVIRESYVNSASGLLNTAGAGGDIEMMHPFPNSPNSPAVPAQPQRKPQITGFQPNKEES